MLTLSMSYSYSQEKAKKIDFFIKVKNYDLSKIWCADSIKTDELDGAVEFPEPLGFIGDNYQRFYIHYSSVMKSGTNPYEYYVSGKTRVKETIRKFRGVITVIEAKLYQYFDDPRYKEGYMICKCIFYEDSTLPETGCIKGTLRSDWYLDSSGHIFYDAIMIVADGFDNNQFEGKWTSYTTGRDKKCNWGDFRIPDSKPLDDGTGDFHPTTKYIKNGWQNYVNAYSGFTDTAKRALKEEQRQWWK
jgi:hypothetical protein